MISELIHHQDIGRILLNEESSETILISKTREKFESSKHLRKKTLLVVDFVGNLFFMVDTRCRLMGTRTRNEIEFITML